MTNHPSVERKDGLFRQASDLGKVHLHLPSLQNERAVPEAEGRLLKKKEACLRGEGGRSIFPTEPPNSRGDVAAPPSTRLPTHPPVVHCLPHPPAALRPFPTSPVHRPSPDACPCSSDSHPTHHLPSPLHHLHAPIHIH
jgi:hypothetical protein